MTDKQIRDRIVGVLSASMMPMEMEAECVAFLDRSLEATKAVSNIPVLSGQWLDLKWDDQWQCMAATCSCCNTRGEVRAKSRENINSLFCPNCGARMDGGNRETD